MTCTALGRASRCGVLLVRGVPPPAAAVACGCALCARVLDRYGEPPAHSHEDALQSIRRAADSLKSDVLTAVEQMRLRREQGALSPGSTGGAGGPLDDPRTLV